MADSLRSKLNPLYKKLFASTGIFDRPEVEEKRATCDNCAMCDQGQLAPVEMDYFQPDTKCCTYHPGLPNYLVGAILADTGEELAEGRRRIRKKLEARIGVTPQYLTAPRKYTLLYVASRSEGAFGRAKSLLCPYFDSENDGRCTVWQYRESVCSTYFCKHESSKPGWGFWNTLKGYLAHVERTLARATAATVDPEVTQPTREPHTLSVEDLEDRPPPDDEYARYWGKWVGREEEFYVSCYQAANKVSAEEFAQNVDDTPDGRRYVAELESRYDAITARTVLPLSLVRAPDVKTRFAGDKVVLTTYNPFDALSMEKELFEVLGLFDGTKSLEENLARLDKEHDIQLAPELLQYLYTHGVVVEPVAPPRPPPPTGAAVFRAMAVSPAGRGGNRQDRRSAQKKKR